MGCQVVWHVVGAYVFANEKYGAGLAKRRAHLSQDSPAAVVIYCRPPFSQRTRISALVTCVGHYSLVAVRANLSDCKGQYAL